MADYAVKRAWSSADGCHPVTHPACVGIGWWWWLLWFVWSDMPMNRPGGAGSASERFVMRGVERSRRMAWDRWRGGTTAGGSVTSVSVWRPVGVPEVKPEYHRLPQDAQGHLASAVALSGAAGLVTLDGEDLMWRWALELWSHRVSRPC